jgi:signal transduction histidine kinase
LLGVCPEHLHERRLAELPGARALAEAMQRVRQGGGNDVFSGGARLVVGKDAHRCAAQLAAVEADGGQGRVAVVAHLEPETALTAARRQEADLVACVSHELRTPLSSIRAYLEMLMDGEAEDELSRSQFYAIMDGETNRLMRLIDNVLGLNRVEAGPAVLQKQRVDLSHLVNETFELIQPQGRAHRLTMRLEELVDVHVLADRDLLMQVLTNLLGNAIKYTPAGGTVTVALRRDVAADEAIVSVSDTGVGIPEKDLPHVFERFYRVGDHRRLAGGTGLGLALVRQVIETLHAGRIVVRSEVDRGSTFTFALPIAEEG